MAESYDPCEAGRFSAYISPDMKLSPYSFDQQERYAVDISKSNIKTAWLSQIFDVFRAPFTLPCINCEFYKRCLGGCPLMGKNVLQLFEVAK